VAGLEGRGTGPWVKLRHKLDSGGKRGGVGRRKKKLRTRVRGNASNSGTTGKSKGGSSRGQERRGR